MVINMVDDIETRGAPKGNSNASKKVHKDLKVTVRATAEELDRWRKAGGKNLSKWIRSIANKESS